MNEVVTVTLTPGFISIMQTWVTGLVNNAIQTASINGGMPTVVVTHDDLLYALQIPAGDIPND
jgi:hypothetical protein